jgi:hypothetical protein
MTVGNVDERKPETNEGPANPRPANSTDLTGGIPKPESKPGLCLRRWCLRGLEARRPRRRRLGFIGITGPATAQLRRRRWVVAALRRRRTGDRFRPFPKYRRCLAVIVLRLRRRTAIFNPFLFLVLFGRLPKDRIPSWGFSIKGSSSNISQRDVMMSYFMSL